MSTRDMRRVHDALAVLTKVRGRDAQWGRTSLSTVSSMANAARRERSDADNGRTWVVFSLKKNGEKSAKPFVNEKFTEEEADRKIKYWEGLNPNTKFVKSRA